MQNSFDFASEIAKKDVPALNQPSPAHQEAYGTPFKESAKESAKVLPDTRTTEERMHPAPADVLPDKRTMDERLHAKPAEVLRGHIPEVTLFDSTLHK